MATTYIPERMSEHWTSSDIERAIEASGWTVVSLPLVQGWEADLPADFLFAASDEETIKLFGLQFKALYHNGNDHWPIGSTQHTTMAQFPWIFYCLSELRNIDERGQALHLAQFRSREDATPASARPGDGEAYLRWGAFWRRVRQCQIGVVVDSLEDARRAMASENGNVFEELVNRGLQVVLANFTRREAVRLSGALTR